jgi:ribosomal protein S12 methylthiotransferase accessory factor
MLTASTYPLFAAPALVVGDRVQCRLPDRAVELQAPSRLLRELIPLCDGRSSWPEIRDRIGGRWHKDDLAALARRMFELGVLVDADDLASHVWRYVKNPRQVGALDSGPLARDRRLAEERRRPRGAVYRAPGFRLRQLLERRASVRTFGETPVPRREILKILWAAYGLLKNHGGHREAMPRRSVPSAGRLYPLVLSLVVLRDGGGLRRGVYSATSHAGGRIALEWLSGETGRFFRAVAEPTILLHAHAALVISGRFMATARRYGARSISYVSIEAGHAAQNAMLAALDAGVASAEFGGFFEERMRDAMALPRDATPLSMVVLGAPPGRDELRRERERERFEFRWLEHPASGYRLPYELAAARLGGQPWWSWGRSLDPVDAYTKAVAEALERRGCEVARSLYEARIGDLKNAIPPTEIVAYSEGQSRDRTFPYARFDPAARYLWKDGTDYVSGVKVPVVADCVYYAVAFPGRRKLLTEASSSGVAGYTTVEGAIERAALELVERDAFMLAWLCRLDTPRIDPRSFPAHIKARIALLEAAGFRVVAKDISRELAPAVLAFAQSAERCITAVGAASGFDREAALSTALMEVEAALAQRLAADKPTPRVRPSQVSGPSDHGNLYAQKQYFRRADFLAAASRSVPLSGIGPGTAKSWPRLLDTIFEQGMRLIAVDVTPENASLSQGRVPFHVYRTIVPGLVPLSFGYRTEALGMPRLLELAKRSRTAPGSLRNPLPHPFP